MPDRVRLADIRERARAHVRGVTFGEHVDGPDRAALIGALDAVLALHKPQDPYRDGVHFTCKGCQTVATFTDYPCPTVRAIESVIDLGGERNG